MRDYKKYEVWKKAHELTLDVYKASKTFPKEETYGITSQLRRACVSVPTNIVEGTGRFSDPQFANFLNIASGSASETDYLLFLSKDLSFLLEDEYLELEEKITRVRKMIHALHKKLC